MAKRGHWQNGALGRQVVLDTANAKAPSDRSEFESAVHSRPTPLSPLAATSLFVVPTKPVKVTGGERKGAKATKNIERCLSKGHILEPEEATAFRALSARGN